MFELDSTRSTFYSISCICECLLKFAVLYILLPWKEIAAFVKTHATDSKTALPLDFLPLQLAKLSFYLWLTGFLVHVAVQVNTTMNKPVPDIYFIAGTMLVAAYFQIDAFRQYAVDRSSLEQQLRSFSVQSAMCSDLQDRSTIEKTILGWFDTDDIEVSLHAWTK